MATSKTNTIMTLKLLVDTHSKKVLFAEAGNDFVDFLFGLLQLPLSSILALIAKNKISVSGSVGKIYNSMLDLNADYLQPNQTEDSLLKPKPTSSLFVPGRVLCPPDNNRRAGSMATIHISSFGQLPCRMNAGSSNDMCTPSLGGLPYHKNAGSSSASGDGCVGGAATHMVMDDLTVKPMSTISSITILSALRVKDISCLEERTVEVDVAKGLKLLKLSFVSTRVLTDLFMEENSESTKENLSVKTVD